MTEAAKPERVNIPKTGVYNLPIMTAPTLLLREDMPNTICIELTPVQDRAPTEARCRMVMRREDALVLAILIAEHWQKQGWPLPAGAVVTNAIH